MKIGPILAILLALIISLAGVSMVRETWRGLKKGEIMAEGRRTSSLHQKDKNPFGYWMTVSVNCVMASGLFAASFWILRHSILSLRTPRRNT